MIQALETNSPAILAFRIADQVSLAEEDEMLAKIDASVKLHSKISILVVLEAGAGWGVRAGLQDLKWLISNLDHLNKLAIVSDNKTLNWLVEADSTFAKLVDIGEKAFATSQMDDAWKWIQPE